MNWLENLKDVIDYIEENLDGEISYEHCAKIACCSEFYFQRIFSYITGITISEYIRKRKMTQAGFDLQKQDSKVINIAFKYGYKSPTAFNRAFKSAHNIPPSEAKKTGATLNSYPKLKLEVNVSGKKPMNYKIVKNKGFRAVGIKVALTENMQTNQKIVPKFWMKTLSNNTFKKISSLNNKNPKGILGITVYENPKKIYYYIAVATDKTAPKNMEELIISPSTWAVFESEDDFKNGTMDIFNNFYSNWLKYSIYEYSFMADVEIYPIYENPPTKGKFKVCIPIKQKENKNEL